MVSREDLGLIVGGISAAALVAGVVLRTSAGGGPPPPGTGSYTVTVHVTDSVTGFPVAGAEVTLGASLPVPTDVSGTAVFTGFPAGSYTMTVVATNFLVATKLVDILADSTFSATLIPVASCVPQPCPCGQAWNSISCSCVPQQLASLVVQATYTFQQSWIISKAGSGPAQAQAYFGSGCPPCTGFPASCPTADPTKNLASIQLTCMVKDVNGHPVCGVPVSAGFPNALIAIPFSGNEGGIFGHFELTFSSSTVRTDQYGFADFIVNISLVDLSMPFCNFPGPCTGSGNYSIPFSVVFSSAGLPNAVSSVDMEALICAYGTFGL